MNAQQVADIFVEQGLLQTSQADEALQKARLNGKTVERAMIESGFIDQHTYYRVIADALGTEVYEFSGEVEPEVRRSIPAGLARLQRALPVGMSDNLISVVLVDPFNLRAA